MTKEALEQKLFFYQLEFEDQKHPEFEPMKNALQNKRIKYSGLVPEILERVSPFDDWQIQLRND